MKEVVIGFLGCGNVGGGVWSLLTGFSREIAHRDSLSIRIKRVLVRDVNKTRACGVPHELLTTNADDVVNDPEISIVVEFMGGEQPATDYMLRALENGKTVVTANKVAIALNWHRLQAAAQRNHVGLYYEASVCGAIPIINTLMQPLQANRIDSLMGIINGTTNYMLSAMTASGVDYTTCLREAQALGYAEADPSADVEGYDARRKLVLSANLAFGASVQEEEIPCFGISSVEKKDFAAWRELGRVCKLFVRAERHEGRISAFVCPTLFPAASPVAQTNGTGNLVTLRGARFGELSFSGAGAGGYPTGSSVLSDCVDVIEGCPSFYVSRHEAKHIDNSAAVGRFYLRTGSETVCTGPITVAEAFARAERARSCGEPVFLARIEEE